MEASPSLCIVPAGVIQLDDGNGATHFDDHGSRLQCDHHPCDRRLAQHVLDGHRTEPLEAAKDAALEFVRLQDSNTQIGIVAFAGYAVIVQSPTTDKALLETAIKNLTTARRTAIGEGFSCRWMRSPKLMT
jgi:hypothetical protein